MIEDEDMIKNIGRGDRQARAHAITPENPKLSRVQKKRIEEDEEEEEEVYEFEQENAGRGDEHANRRAIPKKAVSKPQEKRQEAPMLMMGDDEDEFLEPMVNMPKRVAKQQKPLRTQGQMRMPQAITSEYFIEEEAQSGPSRDSQEGARQRKPKAQGDTVRRSRSPQDRVLRVGDSKEFSFKKGSPQRDMLIVHEVAPTEREPALDDTLRDSTQFARTVDGHEPEDGVRSDDVTGIWLQCLEGLEKGEHQKAFRDIIATGDDLYFLRLLLQNDDGLKKLNRRTAIDTALKTTDLAQSNFIAQLCYQFCEEMLANDVDEMLTIQEQNDYLNVFFENSARPGAFGAQSKQLYGKMEAKYG
jgi:hypothetical protein